jgi:hypothetical protein
VVPGDRAARAPEAHFVRGHEAEPLVQAQSVGPCVQDEAVQALLPRPGQHLAHEQLGHSPAAPSGFREHVDDDAVSACRDGHASTPELDRMGEGTDDPGISGRRAPNSGRRFGHVIQLGAAAARGGRYQDARLFTVGRLPLVQ